MATLNSLPPPPKGQSGQTLDQFKHLPPPPTQQQGVTLEQLQSNKSVPRPEGFAANVASDFNTRTNAAADVQNSDQNPLSKVIQTLGQGAGFVGDIASEGIGSLTPQPIKDVASAGINAIAGTQPVQNGLQAYSDWKAQHPEAAGNLESSFNIASLLPGFKVAGKVAEAGAKGAEVSGKALKGAGEAAYGVTITPAESTRIAMQNYQAKKPTLIERIGGKEALTTPPPTTEANTAARHGLVGTEWGLGVQAKRTADTLWSKTIEPKLNEVKGVVNMQKFFDEVGKDIRKNTKELSRRNDQLEALNALRDEYKTVGKVGLTKLQQYKEGWAQFIPDATYKGKPIASALKDVKNTAAGKARELIYKHAGPEIKQAYLDYGNLKSIMDAGIKSVGDPAKKSLGKNVWQSIMDKAITPVATVSGQVLYRTGDGLEFLGKKGAKNIGDITN